MVGAPASHRTALWPQEPFPGDWALSSACLCLPDAPQVPSGPRRWWRVALPLQGAGAVDEALHVTWLAGGLPSSSRHGRAAGLQNTRLPKPLLAAACCCLRLPPDPHRTGGPVAAGPRCPVWMAVSKAPPRGRAAPAAPRFAPHTPPDAFAGASC